MLDVITGAEQHWSVTDPHSMWPAPQLDTLRCWWDCISNEKRCIKSLPRPLVSYCCTNCHPSI